MENAQDPTVPGDDSVTDSISVDANRSHSMLRQQQITKIDNQIGTDRRDGSKT